MKNYLTHKKDGGYIALITVLILSAVVLVISIGVSLRSIEETQMAFGQQESFRALSLANLCAEKALFKLESSLNYSGNESLTIDDESCDILSIGGTGNFSRVVKAQSTVSKYTKKVQVEVSQISPVMQISSWEEVADF